MSQTTTLACNCLNIIIEIGEVNARITKDFLYPSDEEHSDNYFDENQWYIGELTNVQKVHPGLISSKQLDLWTVTHCLNCELETHAIHKKKGARAVLISSHLLNQEAIDNIRSSNLISQVFNIIVNPNSIEPEHLPIDTYQSRNLEKTVKDFNDIVTNCIRREQAAVEDRIKRYSDEQYELLNVIKDKAYKERETLVQILQNANRQENEKDLSPKSPKLFGAVSSRHSSSDSPSEVPLSPKRPKSVDDEKPRDDSMLVFDFEYDDLVSSRNSTSKLPLDYSDSEQDVEEVGDLEYGGAGLAITSGRVTGRTRSVAKSCPVDIPIFVQQPRTRNHPSGNEDRDDSSPKLDDNIDIAASIKALAKSVHGDTVFGELPRPRFSTQI